MDKKRKTIFYILIGITGMVVLFFAVRFITNSQYSSKIPELNDLSTLPAPVREQISEAVSKAKRKPNSENLGMLGMVYHSSANYDQAAICYDLAARKNSSDWIWNYYHGYLMTELGKSEDAIKDFGNVVAKNPNAGHAWYYIGQEYKNLRKNDEAKEAINKVMAAKDAAVIVKSSTREDHFPISIYAKFLLSRIYFDAGQNELAEKTLNDIVLSGTNLFGPAYRLLGNIFALRGDSAMSKQYVDKANDLLVFWPPVDTLIDKVALVSRSELYLLKKIDEAEKSVYPDWALKLVDHTMQYLPDNQYLISKAIAIYLWNRSDKNAVALIDKHISSYSDNFVEMNNTGMLFYQSGLFQQAIKYWTKALSLKPDEVEAQKNLAICYHNTGDLKKSDEVLKGIIEKNKGNSGILADIMYIKFHLGEREEALGYLAQLKQTAPSNPVVLKMSAEIAEANGDYQKAISLYESSFKNNPEDLQTIRYLGNLLTKQKNWGKYLKHYKEALFYHPNDPEILERLSTCLILCPDPAFVNIKEGAIYSERAFTHVKSPVNIIISAGKNLAYAYSVLGNKQGAISTISKTINIGKQENIPPSFQADLRNLYNYIRNKAGN